MQLLFYYPIKTFCPLQSEYSAVTEQFFLKSIWSYQRSLSGGCITQCLQIRFPLNVSLHEFDPKNLSHDSAQPLKNGRDPPALDGAERLLDPFEEIWFFLSAWERWGNPGGTASNARTWKISWLTTYVVKNTTENRNFVKLDPARWRSN